METVIDINGICISQSDIDELVNEIIKLLSKKNITYAVAYMILNEVKNELQNTIFKVNNITINKNGTIYCKKPDIFTI